MNRSKPNKQIHVKITGLPGVGKTFFVKTFLLPWLSRSSYGFEYRDEGVLLAQIPPQNDHPTIFIDIGNK